MSRPIDEKIVKMSLDNSDFTKKAEQTMGIFSKITSHFKRSKNLDMSKSTRSLADFNGVADKTTLQKLLDGAINATSRMTTLGVIGTTALMNITNRAVDAGVVLTKALTIDPVKDGFTEYELKMKSIQTIMSNTKDAGTTLGEVNDVLDELNVYADKTIYSFADMTSNIGTFTAAGVNLKDSATAIKGISNLAAASGSNTQQASTAMYQLSQALANGKVNLQDWNSVVNAGMGGKLFQNALKRTAEGMGQNIDASKSFRDSLKDNWLTTDVLIKTLNEFANDDSMLEAATKVRTFTQLVDTAKEALGSGWAQTWELLVGDFESAGMMWTQFNDILSEGFEKSANKRNELVKGFVDLGGRQNIIDSILNSFEALSKVLSVVKDGFHAVFPPMTAERMFKISEAIKQFTENLKMSDSTAGKVKTIFQGLFSILSIGITAVKRIASAFGKIIPKNAASSVLDFMVKIANLIIEFDKAFKSGEKLTGGMGKLQNGVEKVGNVLKTVSSWIGKFVSGARAALAELGKMIGPAIKNIFGGIKDFASQFNINDVLNAGFLGGLLLTLKKFNKLQDGVKGLFDSFDGILDGIKNAAKPLDTLTDALNNMTTAVKIGSLVAIAGAMFLLSVSIKMLENVPAQGIAKGLETIGVALFGMTMTLKSISKLDLAGGSALKAGAVLMAVATSVVILAGGLKLISSINPDDLGRSMLSLVTIIGSLVLAVGGLSKMGGKMGTSALKLLVLAASIVILASAVKKLSSIDPEGLTQGIVAMGIMFAELAIFIKVVDKAKFGPGTAIALTIMTGAIHIMVSAIKRLADIDVNSLVKGLTVIAVILTQFAIFTKVVNGAKLINAAIGMTIIAGAINLLAGPIKEFGSMSLETIAKGLGTLAVVLTEVVVAMKMAKGSAGGAGSILLTAFAIKVLVPPLKTLSNMSIKQIATGLITLAGAFTIMGLATKLIGPTGAATLVSFALAIGAVALAIGAVGVTILAFTTALTALATLTVAGVASIVGSLGLLIGGLISLIPIAVKFIVTLVVEIAKGLAEGVPVIASAAFEIIVAILTTLRDNLPQIVVIGADLIIKLMEGIGQKAPELIDAAAKLIVDLINGMANALRDNSDAVAGAMLNVIEAILEALITGLQAILDVLLGWIPGFSEKGEELANGLKEGLRSAFNIEDTGKIGSDGASGFTQGVSSKNDEANTAGTTLATNSKLGAAGVSLNQDGLNAVAQFIGGVSANNGLSNTAGINLANASKIGASTVHLTATGEKGGAGYAMGVSSASGKSRTAGDTIGKAAKAGSKVNLEEEGRWAGQGFASGISSVVDKVASAASRLATAAKEAITSKLKIASPSKVAYEDGSWFGIGFVNALNDKVEDVWNASSNIASAVMEGVEETLHPVMDDLTLRPVVKPILDTSDMGDIPNPNGFRYKGGSNSGGSYNITVNTQASDPRAVAREVEKIIVRGVLS